jgi:hypothetical protein
MQSATASPTDFVKIFRIFGARESLKIIQAKPWSDLRELQRITKSISF